MLALASVHTNRTVTLPEYIVLYYLASLCSNVLSYFSVSRLYLYCILHFQYYVLRLHRWFILFHIISHLLMIVMVLWILNTKTDEKKQILSK